MVAEPTLLASIIIPSLSKPEVLPIAFYIDRYAKILGVLEVVKQISIIRKASEKVKEISEE